MQFFFMRKPDGEQISNYIAAICFSLKHDEIDTDISKEPSEIPCLKNAVVKSLAQFADVLRTITVDEETCNPRNKERIFPVADCQPP